MNIIEMKDDLEARLAKTATPRARIIVGILLLLLVAVLSWIEFHQSSKPTARQRAKASEQFGAALQKAGIQTQATPSP